MAANPENRQRSTLKNIWRLAMALAAAIAIFGELRKPSEQRTWHGKVADFIPYDFRIPTAERFRDTYWNPNGPLVSGTLWGVGWALNIGAIKHRLGF